MHILIIEDDTDIATNLYDYLGSHGHILDSARDGITGLHLAVSHDYDVIVLDLSLPGLDGLSLSKKLRQEARKDVPILMLTARDTLEDKLDGFTHGADDYLVKPFSLREVEARLLALHKRHSGQVTQQVLRVGNLVYDPSSVELSYDSKPIKLPPKCLHLLGMFMSHPNHVFRRAELEVEVWGDMLENSDTLRSHIRSIRAELEKVGAAKLIQTVHGMGYKLVPPDES